MAPFLRKLYLEPVKCSLDLDSATGAKKETSAAVVETKTKKRIPKEWNCLDWCCWMIGYLCTTWWLLLLLFNSLPHYLTGFPIPESPGIKLRNQGLRAHHPVVLVPGIVTGGLELWEGRPCAEGLFRKRLWGGSFSEIFRRPLCWLEHMSLDNETGLDPAGIRVRAVTGLVAADYFAPGYFVWAVLIENLARIGYEGKNMHMAAYDWRLSFQNTEVRDQALSRLKSKIELMVRNNENKKVVVVPHSMGVLYFLHFLKWVEASAPMGGGGGPGWCSKHIKTIVNIGPTFLGVPKAVSGVFSAEAKDIAFIRAMAPGILDSEILGLQTLVHIMRVSRTWDSIMSLLPKGGEAIWGNLDWSPEEGHNCDPIKKNYLASVNEPSGPSNASNGRLDFRLDEIAQYGRMISFGKIASQLSSSEILTADPKENGIHFVVVEGDSNNNIAWADKRTVYPWKLAYNFAEIIELSEELHVLFHHILIGGNSLADALVHVGVPKNIFADREVCTEYDEMSRDGVQRVAEKKVYTAGTLFDLIRFVAPRLMQRGDAHFSHGIADNLDDPKYAHYKYWSNPLETKLPDAPDMEIHCLYGVGIPTERSYVYKMSASAKCGSIPYRIDSSADGGGGCLRGGVYFVDGDESVPALSAGFMCARGWRGRSRFNPSGIATYVREYQHKPPANILEGRGLRSGAHVDIMGNVDLIEDVMRVAAGASGKEMGGDRIYSSILEMSQRIKLRL